MAGGYVGSFLGRLPARPADPGRSIAATPPTVHVGSPPRPPGHPETPAAAQPGPRPETAPGPQQPTPDASALVNTGTPVMQLLARAALQQQTPPPQPALDPISRFLLTRAPNAV